jgi:hypothetical protein
MLGGLRQRQDNGGDECMVAPPWAEYPCIAGNVSRSDEKTHENAPQQAGKVAHQNAPVHRDHGEVQDGN